MKKVAIFIGLLLGAFIVYILQVNIFNTFTIAGISPNLFVIYMLFIGLFTNQILGISFGILIGLILDLLYGRAKGVSAVMFCIIAYLGSYFDKNFSKYL